MNLDVNEKVIRAKGFKRLYKILGFTGAGLDLERKHISVLNVAEHDLRCYRVTKILAEKNFSNISAQESSFLSLVHDYSAIPFRHFALKTFVGELVKNYDFNFKEEAVTKLKADGFIISNKDIVDIESYGISENQGLNLSPEGILSIACESVTGVYEDLILSLYFKICGKNDIRESLLELLGEKFFDIKDTDLSENTLSSIVEKLVIDRLLVFSDLNELHAFSRKFKETARNSFISEHIYNNTFKPVFTDKVEDLYLTYAKQVGFNVNTHEKVDVKNFLTKLTNINELDLINHL